MLLAKFKNTSGRVCIIRALILYTIDVRVSALHVIIIIEKKNKNRNRRPVVRTQCMVFVVIYKPYIIVVMCVNVVWSGGKNSIRENVSREIERRGRQVPFPHIYVFAVFGV